MRDIFGLVDEDEDEDTDDEGAGTAGGGGRGGSREDGEDGRASDDDEVGQAVATGGRG